MPQHGTLSSERACAEHINKALIAFRQRRKNAVMKNLRIQIPREAEATIPALGDVLVTTPPLMATTVAVYKTTPVRCGVFDFTLAKNLLPQHKNLAPDGSYSPPSPASATLLLCSREQDYPVSLPATTTGANYPLPMLTTNGSYSLIRHNDFGTAGKNVVGQCERQYSNQTRASEEKQTTNLTISSTDVTQFINNHDLIAKTKKKNRRGRRFACIIFFLVFFVVLAATTLFSFSTTNNNISHNSSLVSPAATLLHQQQQQPHFASISAIKSQLDSLILLIKNLSQNNSNSRHDNDDLLELGKYKHRFKHELPEFQFDALLPDTPLRGQTESASEQEKESENNIIANLHDTIDVESLLLRGGDGKNDNLHANVIDEKNVQMLENPISTEQKASSQLTPQKAAWLRKLFKTHTPATVLYEHTHQVTDRNNDESYDAADTAALLAEMFPADAAVAIGNNVEARLSGRIVLLPDLYSSILDTESLPNFGHADYGLGGRIASPILMDRSNLIPDAVLVVKPPALDASKAETMQEDATSSTISSVNTTRARLVDELPASTTTEKAPQRSDGRMAIGPSGQSSHLHNSTQFPDVSSTTTSVTATPANISNASVIGFVREQKPPSIRATICHTVSTPICSYRLITNRLERYEYTTLTALEQRQVFSTLDADLRPLIKLNQAPCSFLDDLLPLYCALYVPKCGRNGTALPPCRSFCTRLLHNCEWYMYALNLAPRLYSDLGDCSLFPDSDDASVCMRYIPLAEKPCPPDHHRCDGGRRCIPAEWMCDRFIDCQDRSDEVNCAGCPGDDFVCPDKTCVSHGKVCDGIADCIGGRDEVNCVTLSKGIHSDGQGKLQVYDSETRSWRGVCANNWTTTLSNLTCTALGYEYTEKTAYRRTIVPAITTPDVQESPTAGSEMPLFEMQNTNQQLTSIHATGTTLVAAAAAGAAAAPTTPQVSSTAVTSHRPAFLQWMTKSTTCMRQVELSCATYKCGVAGGGDRSPVPQFRIIGGEKSEPGKWPFLVSIYVGRAKMFFCGGTIISDRWILTAAHCVFDKAGPAAQLHVRVGDHRRSAYSKFKMEHEVVEVVRHPQFASISTGQYVNDIALLRLAQPIFFTDYARPVCLPPPSVPDLLPVDTPCTVIGWGIQTERSGQYSNVVNEVVVRIVGRRECLAWYTQRAPNATVGEDAVCAGYREGKRDACRGDSGGPLLYFNDTLRSWTQVGIVSWGSECARAELPGVYARVSAFTDWVLGVMNEQHSSPPAND